MTYVLRQYVFNIFLEYAACQRNITQHFKTTDIQLKKRNSIWKRKSIWKSPNNLLKKRKRNNFYWKYLRFVWTKRQSTIWFHNKSLESQTLVFFFHLMISLSVWNVKIYMNITTCLEYGVRVWMTLKLKHFGCYFMSRHKPSYTHNTVMHIQNFIRLSEKWNREHLKFTFSGSKLELSIYKLYDHAAFVISNTC